MAVGGNARATGMEKGGGPALMAGASRHRWLEEEGGRRGGGGLAGAVDALRAADETGGGAVAAEDQAVVAKCVMGAVAAECARESGIRGR